jgi:hypothetical protein
MMTPGDGRIEAHTCERCDAVTLHWIRWQNWRGGTCYFCDNDCLAQWIARGLVNVWREARLEHEYMTGHPEGETL